MPNSLNSSFAGGVKLLGLAGDDLLLTDGPGANTLDGGSGADGMAGGAGNDLLIVDYGADVLM